VFLGMLWGLLFLGLVSIDLRKDERSWDPQLVSHAYLLNSGRRGEGGEEKTKQGGGRGKEGPRLFWGGFADRTLGGEGCSGFLDGDGAAGGTVWEVLWTIRPGAVCIFSSGPVVIQGMVETVGVQKVIMREHPARPRIVGAVAHICGALGYVSGQFDPEGRV